MPFAGPIWYPDRYDEARGATDFKEMAESIDAWISAERFVQDGATSVTLNNAAVGDTGPIAFAQPYAAAPRIVASAASGAAQYVVTALATADTLTIGVRTRTGSPTTDTIQLQWIASGVRP